MSNEPRALIQHSVSDDRRSIAGFQIYGAPNLLSDRAILTPGAPGNQRVGLWSKAVNPYDEWRLVTKFRTSGSERPGGSLTIWYTDRGPTGGSASGTDSIYGSKPWDGLALVIDSHTGRGELRGYLNDGTKDFSAHHNPSSLAFAHCDFDYRNKGTISAITVTQTADALRVELDGNPCFETKRARLPRGYYFGITAATSEQPDSFELFKFALSAPQGAKKNAPPAPPPKIKEQPKTQEQHEPIKGRGVHQDGNLRTPGPGKVPSTEEFREWSDNWRNLQGEEDKDAKSFKSQEEQFADLHNRLQGLVG